MRTGTRSKLIEIDGWKTQNEVEKWFFLSKEKQRKRTYPQCIWTSSQEVFFFFPLPWLNHTRIQHSRSFCSAFWTWMCYQKCSASTNSNPEKYYLFYTVWCNFVRKLTSQESFDLRMNTNPFPLKAKVSLKRGQSLLFGFLPTCKCFFQWYLMLFHLLSFV